MNEGLSDGLKFIFTAAIAIMLVCILIAVAGLGFTRLSLWTSAWSGEAKLREAEWSRQIAVREAQAKKDSSVLLAQAEVERAKGVAEANRIIGNSLKGNEQYLRYLWIDSLQNTKDQVIYVPTEAGLPILEAGARIRLEEK